jgi:hypothetical protein
VAEQWFGELERATFQHELLGDLPIPTGHPEDGCYLRAHLWALRLKQLGAPVQKIFVARTGPLLSIQSATAAGATREHPVEVNWGYHVAPVVRVHDEAGRETWAVFDPAMRDGLMSAQDWLARTGVTGIEPIHGPLPNISAMLLQNSVEHPEWWTPEGTQRLPLGAVSVVTDMHAYGFPHPGNGFPDGIRTTDNAVRNQEHLMVDHTFADMERQLQRGVLDVLGRGLTQDETLAELRRLADGNPQALGFLEREQNLDHSVRLLMALPDRLGELNGIFPALFDPALLHGSDDWLADLLGPTPAEAVLPHTGSAEQHAPADFDFTQWLTEQAMAQPAHDGFDYQGWAQHFAATEPPAGSAGAGSSHHVDALDPADHTGPALADDFDFDAFLRGQINLDGAPADHRPAPPEHHEEVETRPAPPELSPHLLEPIPDLATSHATVDADGLAATLAGHGAHEETSRLVVDAAKDAVDATRSLEGEEAAGRFAAAMPHAMRLLEKAGAVTKLLRQAGDAVTAGLTLSHVMEGVARAWAQGGNAAAAAAVAQDMKRLGLGFAEVNTEGIEADAQ